MNLKLAILGFFLTISLTYEKARADENRKASVELKLYYEAKCPYCLGFFDEFLAPMYPYLSSILDLTLVPFGNAQYVFNEEEGQYMFSCQHGPDECAHNMVQTCAVELHPKHLANNINFCIMSHILEGENEKLGWRLCCDKHGVDYAQLIQCARSTQGAQALANMGEMTLAEQEYQYSPWMNLNGDGSLDMNEILRKQGRFQFVQTICNSVDEEYRPPVCSYDEQKINSILPRTSSQ